MEILLGILKKLFLSYIKDTHCSMVEYFVLFGITMTVAIVMNKIANHYDKTDPFVGYKNKRNYNVQYYSEGVLLPKPFHEEYKMISYTVANSWIYEEQWQGLVNENHYAPIVEIEIKQPIKYKYFYTFKHVFLANSYLKDQSEYLGNLN